MLPPVLLWPAPPALCRRLATIVLTVVRGSLRRHRPLLPSLAAVRGYGQAVRGRFLPVLHPGMALPRGVGRPFLLRALAGRAGLAVCRRLLLRRVLEGSVRPGVRARQARAANEGNGSLDNEVIPLLSLWSAWPVVHADISWVSACIIICWNLQAL